MPSRAGVTFITHGLNGDVEGWITGMANAIPSYCRFPGTNYTCYKAYFYYSNGYYYLTASRVAGSEPTEPESGEIIVKFDWSNLANGDDYNTFQIASAAVPALLNANFIPELRGHALAEFPLHLIGHSRGGSLVCEISRLLGTNGVWVDHLTTLDPHPLNDPSFPWDWVMYTAVDAPAQTYENVLFHDNYWQDLDLFTIGKSVPGAYVRQFYNLPGGYGSSHSDAHLWYHGSIDLTTPATDTEVWIGSTERSTWYSTPEAQGASAGFHYSLVGRGDRLSASQPLGPGQPAIRDGFNQNWDLGAGLYPNRTALPSNSGAWPNMIRLNRNSTNAVVQGDSTSLKFFYQWSCPNAPAATISFFLDDDLNPINGNEKLLSTISAPVTGSSLGWGNIAVPIFATNATPGWHALLATIAAPGYRRYLYAPELVEIVPTNLPPVLSIGHIAPSRYQLSITGLLGQRVVLQSSPDLVGWQPLATNTLTTTTWLHTNTPPADAVGRFYRAMLQP